MLRACFIHLHRSVYSTTRVHECPKQSDERGKDRRTTCADMLNKLNQNCNISPLMLCFSLYTDQIAMLFLQYRHQVILQACNVYSFVFYKGVGMLGYQFNIIMKTVNGIVIYQTINLQNDTIYVILLLFLKYCSYGFQTYIFVNLRLCG